MKINTSYLINFSLIIISTVIFLSLIEVAFRVTWPPEQDRARSGYVIEDPDLIWRLKPQSNGPLKTNELGFRDSNYIRDADIKILVLGDSITWGEGIKDQRYLYTSLLETTLHEEQPHLSFEVINTGVPGYSTFQERVYLEKYGLALKPDIIILQFCLNDIFEPYLTLASLGGDSQFLGIDTRKGVHGIFGFILQHSRAFEWTIRNIQKFYRKREEYTAKKLCKNILSKELYAAWDKTLNEIQKIINQAKENNIPIILLIAPYNFQLDKPEETSQPQQILTNFSNQLNVYNIDLLPSFFQAKMKYNIPLFRDENHFSKFGHYVTAKIISEFIQEKFTAKLIQ